MFGQRSNTVVENRRKLLERCIQSLTSRVLHPNHIPIVQAFLTPELEESQIALTAKQNLHTHQEKIKQTQKVEHRSAVVRLLVNPPGQHHSMNEQVCQPWHYTRSPDVVTLFQSNAVSHPGRVAPRMPRSISSRNEPYHDAHPLRVHW